VWTVIATWSIIRVKFMNTSSLAHLTGAWELNRFKLRLCTGNLVQK
jgi:hypothetical protein